MSNLSNRSILLTLLLSIVIFAGFQDVRAEDKNGVSPSRLKLPKGPGSLEGVGENVELNLNMGLMSYGVPLTFPMGYQQVSPSFRLSYQSGGGNSTVGLGWQLGTPSIERMTSKGIPKYTSEDFISSGEELVKISDEGNQRSIFRARIERNFIRYTWYQPGAQGYWKVEYADGSIGYFGADHLGSIDANSRVYGPDGTFRYHLVEKVDPLGHRIKFTYRKVQAYSLLDKVEYVFDQNGDPKYRIQMIYENRPDQISYALPGFDLRLDQRLKAVVGFSRGQQRIAYQLHYDDSNGISLLSSVETYGRNNDTPLPSIQRFQYTSGELNPIVVEMEGNTGLGWWSGDTDFIDINSDGLPDVLDTKDGVHTFYINQIDSAFFNASTQQSSGQHRFTSGVISQFDGDQSGARLSDPLVQPLDLNGDGFTDLVNASADPIEVLWNKGEGDWSQVSVEFDFGFPDFRIFGSNLRFYDWDNDKRIDVIFSDRMVSEVYPGLEDGGFGEPQLSDDLNLSFTEDQVQMADMNGDGLQDAVRRLGDIVVYRLNLGLGRWSQDIMMDDSPRTDQTAKVMFTDINGDALSDLLFVNADQVGFALNRNGRHFGDVTLVNEPDIPIYTEDQYKLRLADMNANGSTDLVYISQNGQVTYLDMFTERRNLLTRIENGLGKVIEVEYGSSVADQASAREQDESWQYSAPNQSQVVREIYSWDVQSSGDSKQRVKYRNSFYDPIEKAFRGFSEVELSLLGDQYVEELRGISQFDVGQLGPHRAGLLIHEEKFSAGRLISKTDWSYGECPIYDPSTSEVGEIHWSCVTSETNRIIEQGELETQEEALANAITTKVEYSYDRFGNKTLVAQLGIVEQGSGCSPCTAETSNRFGEVCNLQDQLCRGDELYTETTFVTPQTDGLWKLHSPCVLKSYGEPGSERYAETRTFYDGLNDESDLCSMTQGLVTYSDIFNDGIYEPLDTMVYNEHGFVITKVGALGGIQTFEYDETSLHLLSEERVYEDRDSQHTLRMEASYDEPRDLILSVTDWFIVGDSSQYRPRSKYTYDQFGRLDSLYYLDSLREPSKTFEVINESDHSRIISRTQLNDTQYKESIACFDGQGLKFQSLFRLGDGRYQVSGFGEFGAQGKLVRSYDAYTKQTDDCDLTPPEGLGYTENYYDGLGRKTRSTMNDAEFYGTRSQKSTFYKPLLIENWSSLDNDEQSEFSQTPKIVQMNGLNKIIQVTDKPTQTEDLNYKISYDPLGFISHIKNVNGREQRQVYNARGRLIESFNPNFGHIYFDYDLAGQQIRMTNSLGESVNKEYDIQGRITSIWEERDGANRGDTEITYNYDKYEDCLFSDCRFGAGHLTKINYPLHGLRGTSIGSQNFKYNAYGSVEELIHIVDGVSYHFALEYDLAQRKIAKKFPTELKLTYKYDVNDRLKSVSQVIDNIDYNEQGNVSKISYSDGSTRSVHYDSAHRIGRFQVLTNGNIALDETYEYDRDRKLTMITDLANGELPWSNTSAFAYDGLGQLVKSSFYQSRSEQSLSEEITYEFDNLRRLINKSSTTEASKANLGDLFYLENQYNAVARIEASSGAVTDFNYDTAGRVININSRSYQWDSWGRLLTVLESGEERIRSSYGPNETRVFKREGDQIHWYLDPEFEISSGVSIHKVLIDNKEVARLEDNTKSGLWLSDLAPAHINGQQLSPAQLDQQVTAADAWIAHLSSISNLEVNAESVDEPKVLLETSSSRLVRDRELTTSIVHRNPFHNSEVTLRNGKLFYSNTYPYGGIKYEEPGFEPKYALHLHERDRSVDLIFAKNRHLDSRFGLWITPDPISRHIKSSDLFDISARLLPYTYVSNDPINNFDPNGLFQAKVNLGAFAKWVCKGLDCKANTEFAIGYDKGKVWVSSAVGVQVEKAWAIKGDLVDIGFDITFDEHKTAPLKQAKGTFVSREHKLQGKVYGKLGVGGIIKVEGNGSFAVTQQIDISTSKGITNKFDYGGDYEASGSMFGLKAKYSGKGGFKTESNGKLFDKDNLAKAAVGAEVQLGKTTQIDITETGKALDLAKEKIQETVKDVTDSIKSTVSDFLSSDEPQKTPNLSNGAKCDAP